MFDWRLLHLNASPINLLEPLLRLEDRDGLLVHEFVLALALKVPELLRGG